MNIILRFDDICPTMNWEQFDRAKALLDGIGAKALLGVVPDCKDPDLQIDSPRADFWEQVKKWQKEGYTIAMHGLYHRFDIEAKGIVTPRKRSEFAGHSYKEQYEKIKRGKDILNEHGIETDVFFAPAHSFDDNTLRALAVNGFRYVSDGLSRKPYCRQGIIMLPVRSGSIPKHHDGHGCYTAVFHAHEWVRPDKAFGWATLQNICENHRDEIVSFDEYKNQALGCSVVQRVSEKGYYCYMHFLKPIATKAIRAIKP